MTHKKIYSNNNKNRVAFNEYRCKTEQFDVKTSRFLCLALPPRHFYIVKIDSEFVVFEFPAKFN